MTVLRRRLLGALIAAVPLMFLPDVSLDPVNVPKHSLLAVGLGVILCLWALEWALGGRIAVFDGAAIPVLALLVPLSVGWLFSDYRGWAFLGEHGRSTGLLPYVLVAVAALLVADAFRGATHELVVFLAASGTLVSTYLIVQALGLDPVWKPGDSPGYPPSTVGHFNFSGGFIALCLPATAWLWLEAEGRVRVFWTAATILHAGALILSFSQGAWAAGFVGTVVMASWQIGARNSLPRKMAAVVAAGMALLIVGSVVLSGIIRIDAGATARTRAVLWESALQMASESPVVGHGPDSYLIEADRHRTAEEGLTTESARSGDPHSIPLAMLANAGALGLIGFLVIAYWAVRNALRATEDDPAAVALLAIVAAYLTQALVTIDVPTLRVTFWSAVGGVAASLTRDASVSRRVPRIARVPIAVGLVAIGIALVVLPGPFFLGPDIRMQEAQLLISEGEFDEAIPLIRDAIERRPEPEYRVRLVDAYGFKAVEAEEEGRRFIDKAVAASDYLETLPYFLGHVALGHVMHQWAYFDPSVETDALRHLQEAVRLDPAALPSRIEAAESLIVLDRGDEAIELLRPAVDAAPGRYPELWGMYSIALLLEGDPDAASDALREADRIGPACHSLLAEELFRVVSEGDPEPPDASFLGTAGFRCERGEMYFFARVVPDELADDYLAD